VQPLLQWKSDKYYVFRLCVSTLALVIRHSNLMRRDVTCVLSGYPHYLINDTIFGKKELLITECVFRFSLQILSKTFLILSIIQHEITIYVQRSSRKVPVNLIRF